MRNEEEKVSILFFCFLLLVYVGEKMNRKSVKVEKGIKKHSSYIKCDTLACFLLYNKYPLFQGKEIFK